MASRQAGHGSQSDGRQRMDRSSEGLRIGSAAFRTSGHVRIWTPPRFASALIDDFKVRLRTYIRPLKLAYVDAGPERAIRASAPNRFFGLDARGHFRVLLTPVRSVGSVLLFATLGTGAVFINARQFSAYLGLTPKQYSSGGKVNLVGLSRRVASKRLRAVLIQGARAYVYKLKETENDQGSVAVVAD